MKKSMSGNIATDKDGNMYPVTIKTTDVVLAKLFLNHASKWSQTEKKYVAEWLRRQAKELMTQNEEYSDRFTAECHQ